MDGIGERLREARARLGLTQTQVAKDARISKAYLSELEGGAGRRPSADVMLRLADALHVTIADLLGRTIRPAEPVEIPQGLADFAAEKKLSEEEVRTLAGVRLREGTPQTKERWAFIYAAIQQSRALDPEQ